ncbi:hypothetical protein K491DRAFT_692407 [Lophiostoma macrostomum CBS 122681]|uniref:Uncharacterized protein n=1 Tax=Lophiostoma macrostomum CBS 122681 TaxID=1314788 RepID=A0A6A6T7U0_9PLEO|nr:hypothetical protein K491DRAFT_692407 [Lophiostoma macrostomum CBS 122681]
MESAEALLARFEDFVTSNIYLLTAVIVVAHIIGYNLLSEHPLSAGKSPSLRISEVRSWTLENSAWVADCTVTEDLCLPYQISATNTTLPSSCYKTWIRV